MAVRGQRRLVAAAVVVVIALALATAPAPRGSAAIDAALTQDSRFGIAHVIYGDGSAPPFNDSQSRLDRAAAAGAGWDRWALYWSDVEQNCGSYNFSAPDAAVALDRSRGLRVNAVLANTPACRSTGATALGEEQTGGPLGPRLEEKRWLSQRLLGRELAGISPAESNPYIAPPTNLYEPTFADGSDSWAPGKAVNPNNPWALFVNTTVTRYRGQVDLWEMRNEPDRADTWSGSVAQYVRLLKVGYLAAKAADPNAKVAAGGIAYWSNEGWLDNILAGIVSDPSAAANDYYFDVMPFHWYSRSSDVYDKTVWARQRLAARGITGKEIWVNESNVPVCDEARPAWPVLSLPFEVSCANHDNWFAPAASQADYVIQSFAYALAADVRTLVTFQMFDDGNEYMYGLHRNDTAARPAVAAYRTAVAWLGGATSASRSSTADYERIDVTTGGDISARRATVVWKRTPGDGAIAVPAISSTATIVEANGSTASVSASGGQFYIPLRGATTYFQPADSSYRDYFIGGSPRILVQSSAPAIGGGLIENGSFESGNDCSTGGPDSWTCYGASTGQLTSAEHYGGNRSLMLDGGGSYGNAVAQVIELPAGGNPKLNFAYRIVTNADTARNSLRVLVSLENQYPLFGTSLFEGSTPGPWRLASVDLSAYNGQRIYVTFNVQQESDQPFVSYLDAVSVWPFRYWMPVVRHQ